MSGNIWRKVKVTCVECSSTESRYSDLILNQDNTIYIYCSHCNKVTLATVEVPVHIIAIDFDGTCVTHAFPAIGEDIGAVPFLRLLSKNHKLILYTMRSNVANPKSEDKNIIARAGNYLDDAIDWFAQRGIELYGVNENPEQKTWTYSPKVYADLYIDDAGVGIPLAYNANISERPYVDWNILGNMLKWFKLI